MALSQNPNPTGQQVLAAAFEAKKAGYQFKNLNEDLTKAWNATREETNQVESFHDSLPSGKAYEWRSQEFANWKHLPKEVVAILKQRGFVKKEVQEQTDDLKKEVEAKPEPKESTVRSIVEGSNALDGFAAIRTHHDRTETGFSPLAVVNGLRNTFSEEEHHNQLPDQGDKILDPDKIFDITRRTESSVVNEAIGNERNHIGDAKNYLDKLEQEGKLSELQGKVDALVDDLDATDWNQDFATIKKTRIDWHAQQAETHTSLELKLAEYLEDNNYKNLAESREVMANEQAGVGILRLQADLSKGMFGRMKILDKPLSEVKNQIKGNQTLEKTLTSLGFVERVKEAGKRGKGKLMVLNEQITLGAALETARKELKVNKMPVSVGDLLMLAREKTESGESFTDAYTIQVDNGPRPNLATLGRVLLALAPVVLPPLALGSGLQLSTILDWEDRKLTEPQELEAAFREAAGRSLSAEERKALWQFTQTGTLPLDFADKILNDVVKHEQKTLPIITSTPSTQDTGAGGIVPDNTVGPEDVDF